ncbi:hypothetical protein ACHMWN_08550 [Pedobacter sp. UC225_61]|uniref:hypothetical protein n=1 Tax=Pedobacter sp. UC225_61 TaxID=3374623 RepID=UPI0037AA939B
MIVMTLKRFQLVMLLCVTLLVSCLQRDKKVVVTKKDTTYLAMDTKPYMILGQIPDSLESAEQVAHVKKLYGVLVKYTTVEHEEIQFKLDKKSFVNMGLSKSDYDRVVNGLRESNTWIGANQIGDVDKMIEKWKTEINIDLQQIEQESKKGELKR